MIRPSSFFSNPWRTTAILAIAATLALAAGIAFHHPASSPELLVPASSIPAGDRIVYVTAHGKKYHALGCLYLHGHGKPMKQSDAIAAGFTACSKCGG